jgi:hypothetical protein
MSDAACPPSGMQALLFVLAAPPGRYISLPLVKVGACHSPVSLRRVNNKHPQLPDMYNPPIVFKTKLYYTTELLLREKTARDRPKATIRTRLRKSASKLEVAKQYHQRLEEISDVQLRLRSRERVTTTANVWMCLHHARCSTGSRGRHAPYHNSFECNCHISSPSTTMEPPTSTKLRPALISASNNNANRASPLKLTLQSHTKRARTKFELRCGNQRGSKSRNHSNKRWYIFRADTKVV